MPFILSTRHGSRCRRAKQRCREAMAETSQRRERHPPKRTAKSYPERPPRAEAGETPKRVNTFRILRNGNCGDMRRKAERLYTARIRTKTGCGYGRFLCRETKRVINRRRQTVPRTRKHGLNGYRPAHRGSPYPQPTGDYYLTSDRRNLSWIRMCYPQRRHECRGFNSKTYLLHVLKSK
mgnify:CR=1 FL=1